VASATGSFGTPPYVTEVPVPIPSSRSRNSTSMRSAVFLPMPGMRVSAAMSPSWINRANSSVLTPERTASEILAPMPLTFCRLRKRLRSASRRNPYRTAVSSFTA